jgi:hypothetical protein
VLWEPKKKGGGGGEKARKGLGSWGTYTKSTHSEQTRAGEDRVSWTPEQHLQRPKARKQAQSPLHVFHEAASYTGTGHTEG